MVRRLHSFVALAALALAFVFHPAPVPAQGKIDHPHLRAALHELRDARRWLERAEDNWPPGHKERALASTKDAIDTVKQMLAVKDVDSFRGVERRPDYYDRYRDHPRLRAALSDLRDARQELRSIKDDFGGLRERALDDIDAAAGDIVHLIRNNKPKR